MASFRSWLPRVGAVLAVTLAIGVPGAPAQAVTVGTATVESATKVNYTAGTGHINTITVTRSGRTVTIDDRVTITPGTGCRRVGTDATRVVCTTTSTPTLVTMSAGDKNDTIVNKTGLAMNGYGGSGNDTVTGSGRNDKLDGGTGNDTLLGLGGTDVLLGQAGNDSLDGGVGNDMLTGATGADVMKGGSGDDTADYRDHGSPVVADLDGVTGDDGQTNEKDTISADVESILGGLGNDTLVGNKWANVLDGGKGNDVLRGGDADDVLVGGDGDDNLAAEGQNDQILGGAGVDVIKGGWGDDTISGEAGNDTVWGDNGDDVIHGDDGDDLLRGGNGKDFLLGGAGNDRVYGDAYDDFLWGNGGPNGDVDTELDALDGGASANDSCYVGRLGKTTNCE